MKHQPIPTWIGKVIGWKIWPADWSAYASYYILRLFGRSRNHARTLADAIHVLQTVRKQNPNKLRDWSLKDKP